MNKKKLQAFDSSYLRGKGHFEENGTQNCLVFQPIGIYFKKIIGVGNGEYIYFWKSKGLSDERINSITASDYTITLSLAYFGAKIRVKFNGIYLKQDKITYTHEKIVNIYEINKILPIISYSKLENCLFGAVTLTKNADIYKCRYQSFP